MSWCIFALEYIQLLRYVRFIERIIKELKCFQLTKSFQCSNCYGIKDINYSKLMPKWLKNDLLHIFLHLYFSRKMLVNIEYVFKIWLLLSELVNKCPLKSHHHRVGLEPNHSLWSGKSNSNINLTRKDPIEQNWLLHYFQIPLP